MDEDTSENDDGPPRSRQQLAFFPTLNFLNFPSVGRVGPDAPQQQQQQNAYTSTQPAASARHVSQQYGTHTENAAGAISSSSSSRPPGQRNNPDNASAGREDGTGMRLSELHELQKTLEQSLQEQQQQFQLMQAQAQAAQQMQQQQHHHNHQLQQAEIQRQMMEWGENSLSNVELPSASLGLPMPRMPSSLLNAYLDSGSGGSERSLPGGSMGMSPLPPTATEQQQQQQPPPPLPQYQQPSAAGPQHHHMRMSNQNQQQQQAVLYSNNDITARQIGGGGTASIMALQAPGRSFSSASRQQQPDMDPRNFQHNEFLANYGLSAGNLQEQQRHQQQDIYQQQGLSANHPGMPATFDASSRMQQQVILQSQHTAVPQQSYHRQYEQNVRGGMLEGNNVPVHSPNMPAHDEDEDEEKEKLDHSVIHGGFHPMVMDQTPTILPIYAQPQQQSPQQIQQQVQLNQHTDTSTATGSALPPHSGNWQPQQKQDTSFAYSGTSSNFAVTASSSSINSSTNLHERILHLDQAMECSMKSQRFIQDWDTKMGLRRCHSKTMRQTTVSRRKVQDLMVSTIMRGGAAASLFVPKQA
mmetsp:Transcript_2816/g.8276  ORF Transcript_2816/g.8276 Transcript_2816/m.8276 type:complete len:583 (-) Transcript_2816:189-1937(-)